MRLLGFEVTTAGGVLGLSEFVHMHTMFSFYFLFDLLIEEESLSIFFLFCMFNLNLIFFKNVYR